MGNEKDDYLYEYVGFLGETGREIIIILSTLSLFVNTIFIINYLSKILRHQSSKMSILEKVLLLLSIIEWLISLLWILSAFFYPTNREIRENVEEGFINGCKFISYLSIYLYILDWLILGYSIFLIKQVIFVGALKEKSKKNFLTTIAIYLLIAIVAILLTHFFHYRGESPMITCSLSIISEKKKELDNFFSYFVFFLLILIPFGNLLYCISQIIIVCKNPTYKTDKENQKFFLKYIIYIGSYVIFTLLLLSLYIFSYFLNLSNSWDYYEVRENKFILWYFRIVTMISCSSPFIIGLIRFFQTGLFYRIRRAFKDKNFNLKILIPMLDNTQIDDNRAEMINFEKKALLKFVTNIYISVCYCLEKDLRYEDVNENDIKEKLCKETEHFHIKKSNLNDSILANDETVNEREDFKIEVYEYAPKIFMFLRKLEGENVNKMIRAFLPSLNKVGIGESEGRSGNFFINTYDKQYMLKTINNKEVDLLRNKLLYKMCLYLKDNKTSLISRIYGLYKIKISGVIKEEEIYIILMKNVFGTFHEENIMKKYDLKGSVLNRRVDTIKGQKVQRNVLKDINFNETEKTIKVSKKNSISLTNIINSDAEFLCQQEIMDYSLLVIKISIQDLENRIIFGDKIVDYHNRLYDKIKKKITSEFNNKNDINNNNIDINNDKTKQKIIDNLIKENDNDSNNSSFDNSLDKSMEIKIRYSKNDITFDPRNISTIKKYCWPSIKPDFIYVIAIIDFFQLYDINKKMETAFKGIKHKKEDISSMDAEGYKKRFIEAMNKITDYNNIIKNIVEDELNKDEKNV